MTNVEPPPPIERVGEQETLQTLISQRKTWDERPLLRKIYRRWYVLIAKELAPTEKVTVELGCGIGTFKEWYPAAVATDVLPTPWTEQVVDAEMLCFRDETVGNLVLIDVLHHLPNPKLFFAEAQRVLTPRGRLILLEPYCSPLSGLAYRLFHHERTDKREDPFAHHPQSTSDPFDSNQALPTLLFWRHLKEFQERYKHLVVLRRRRLAILEYPLSGGFSKRPLLPPALSRPVRRLDDLLHFLSPVAAFRCLVTIEKSQ
jgi:SAM-dependent methyltransferase